MKMMKKTRIIIVDDHKLVHHSIGQSLKMEKNFQVDAEADTGISAVALAAKHRPDISIMDIGMPGMNGMEATRQILAVNPNIKILALTMHTEKIYIREMFNAGACGYILKSCAYNELLYGIKTVLSGKIYLSQDIAHLLTHQDKNTNKNHSKKEDGFSQLSCREREILQRVTEGHTSRKIAGELGISPKTVDIHRNNVKKKLGIHTIAGLTKFALARGLTSVTP